MSSWQLMLWQTVEVWLADVTSVIATSLKVPDGHQLCSSTDGMKCCFIVSKHQLDLSMWCAAACAAELFLTQVD